MRHAAIGQLLLLISLLPLAPASAAAVDPPVTLPFETIAIQAAAKELSSSGTLRIRALPLPADGKDLLRDLELERFEVFAPGARIVLHTASGERSLPIPRNVYLRGGIAGDPRSRAVISVLETGEIRGLVTATGHVWIVGMAKGESLLRSLEIGPLEGIRDGGDFRCELDEFGPAAFRAGSDTETDPLAAWLDPGLMARLQRPGLAGFDHTALIAIETDTEFLDLPGIGGDTTAATNYIADLTAFASAIYTREVQTSWQLGQVSLWQGPDVYSQTGGCGLLEFGNVWNLPPNSLIPRTTAHFLSGKDTNSGIAWIGVLCNAAFTTSPANLGITCPPPVSGTGLYGGAYGFTAGIDGNFNIENPTVVWDILAYSHEVGHNFNSPHTHCYQGLHGNAAAVDNCNAGQCGTTGCYCGTTSLPAGCPGAGQGCGTIMSYCHLLGGNLGNITLTLGLNHPYGVAPERVPQRMRDHVIVRAAANPACLAPQAASFIFIDGFESGNISNWH